MKGISEQTLRTLYVDRKMTTRQIASAVNLGHRTIARRLHQFGIKPRQQGPEKFMQLQSKDWLDQQYTVLGLSGQKIADGLGCSPRIVNSWITQHGIVPRSRGGHLKGTKASAASRLKMSLASKGKRIGAANPNWRGGYVDQTSRERRSYASKQWRDAVRNRDGRKCRECGSCERLHAHHIKSWHKHPEFRYDVDNGLTLCSVCHQKAHKFRFPAWLSGKDEMPTSAEHPSG